MHLLAGQKRQKDEYKDPEVLPKVKKAYMAGMVESIKEYCSSHHGVMRAPLAYIVRKTIIVRTNGDYLKYATPDDEMIAKMLHLPQEQSALSVKEHMTVNEIDNRSVYDHWMPLGKLVPIQSLRHILVHICCPCWILY